MEPSTCLVPPNNPVLAAIMMAAGMDEHLTKPFSRDDLVRVIRRFVGPAARAPG